MIFKIIKNNRSVKLTEIPESGLDLLLAEIISECSRGRRLIGFFASKGNTTLYIVLADDESSTVMIAKASLAGVKSYKSITAQLPQAHMFEREFYEETGIVPQGHPWLKGVRFSNDRFDKKETIESYGFFKMTGDEVHEVAVGPVHAGVIEPGHFRFMCHGEKVYHLEIQLGYQHRGVEKLFVKNKSGMNPYLAESIAGDTVIGHAEAHCAAVEALSGIDVPKRANAIRGLALELERAAMHTGDLSAICGDIAYLPGNSVFGANRTTIINSLLAICGSRFGRGLLRPGGVAFDISPEMAVFVKSEITKAYENIRIMAEETFSSSSVLSRLQETGVLEKQQAIDLGVIGFAARASGVALDSRADHPYGIYNFMAVRKHTMESGDVFARAYMRYMEISQSVELIKEILDNLPAGGIMKKPGALEADSMAISMVEGWRGCVMHAVISDSKGNIERYKIKDASFNNWYGLALSVRNNGISDFPLINKSFNLSYCGNDL
jgi:Ni,Fe-hydrogenase III large subunit